MSELDRYLDRFGVALLQARPSRRRRGLALGGVIALAAAVATLVLVLGPGGGSRPLNAIAAARKQLDPTGVILHFRISLRNSLPGVDGAFEETWSAQDPQRWRMRSSGDGRTIQETSYGGGEQRYLDGKHLIVTTGYKDYTPQTRLPTIFSQNGNDPDADLRAMLLSGKLQDDGNVLSGGRSVRRLVRDDGLRTLVFDVDPTTFVPVAGSLTYHPPTDSKVPEIVTRFTVDVFERLPITPDTERLLTITPPPGTTTSTRTTAELERYQKAFERWRQRCKHRPRKHKVCPAMPKLPGTGSP